MRRARGAASPVAAKGFLLGWAGGVGKYREPVCPQLTKVAMHAPSKSILTRIRFDINMVKLYD